MTPPATTLSGVLRARGLTAADFAGLTGYSLATVQALSKGAVAPWPEFRRRASAVLRVPERVLFPESGER